MCFHWHLHLQLWPFGSDKWCVRWNFSFSFLTTYPAGIEGHRFHFLSRVLLQPDGYQFQLLFSQSLSNSFSHTYWASIGSAKCLARTLTVVHSSFQSFGSSEVWIWWNLDHFISLWELAYRCSWINLAIILSITTTANLSKASWLFSSAWWHCVEKGYQILYSNLLVRLFCWGNSIEQSLISKSIPTCIRSDINLTVLKYMYIHTYLSERPFPLSSISSFADGRGVRSCVTCFAAIDWYASPIGVIPTYQFKLSNWLYICEVILNSHNKSPCRVHLLPSVTCMPPAQTTCLMLSHSYVQTYMQQEACIYVYMHGVPKVVS